MMPTCSQCPENEQAMPIRRLDMTKTTGYSPPFFDSDGKEHTHDANLVTEKFGCQAGHQWTVRSVSKCWCGWPKDSDEANQALRERGIRGSVG